MDAAKEKEVLMGVMARHVEELTEASEGKYSVADLEKLLLDRQSPLMQDLFQTLIQLRQGEDFPPTAPTEPQ